MIDQDLYESIIEFAMVNHQVDLTQDLGLQGGANSSLNEFK
jgi:hypothetical protein